MLAGLADPVDDKDVAVLRRVLSARNVVIAKHFRDPYRIAHCPHRLVDDDDPPIGDLQRPPIRRCRYAGHIDNDVMELRA